MTQPLADGWLLIAPPDAARLVAFVQAGALTFRGRRNLTPGEADLVMAVEQAGYAARKALGSNAGTSAVPLAADPAVSITTVSEAAGVLGVSESYVRRLCRTGQLAATRPGSGWLVDAASVTVLALSRGEAA